MSTATPRRTTWQLPPSLQSSTSASSQVSGSSAPPPTAVHFPTSPPSFTAVPFPTSPLFSYHFLHVPSLISQPTMLLAVCAHALNLALPLRILQKYPQSCFTAGCMRTCPQSWLAAGSMHTCPQTCFTAGCIRTYPQRCFTAGCMRTQSRSCFVTAPLSYPPPSAFPPRPQLCILLQTSTAPMHVQFSCACMRLWSLVPRPHPLFLIVGNQMGTKGNKMRASAAKFVMARVLASAPLLTLDARVVKHVLCNWWWRGRVEFLETARGLLLMLGAKALMTAKSEGAGVLTTLHPLTLCFNYVCVASML